MHFAREAGADRATLDTDIEEESGLFDRPLEGEIMTTTDGTAREDHPLLECGSCEPREATGFPARC
jgi:hypothetical protein